MTAEHESVSLPAAKYIIMFEVTEPPLHLTMGPSIPYFLGCSALWLGSIRQRRRRLKCLSGQREGEGEGGRPIQASLWGTGNDGGADRMGDDHKSSTISAAGRTGNGQKSILISIILPQAQISCHTHSNQ